MPIASPFLKSSSEIFLKSSVEVGSPSAYMVVPSVLYSLADRVEVRRRWSPSCRVSLGEDHGEQHGGPVLGVDRTERGDLRVRRVLLARAGYCARDLQHHRRVEPAEVVQGARSPSRRTPGRVVAPSPPTNTNVSGETSCSSPFCSRSFCAWIASGLFVKSKSLLSAGLSSVLRAAKPANRIDRPDPDRAPGVPAARSCDRLGVEPHPVLPSLVRLGRGADLVRLLRGTLRHMLTMYGVYGYGVRCQPDEPPPASRRKQVP